MRAFVVSALILAAPLALSAEGRFAPFRGVSLDAMRDAPSRELRPVGSTSLVYRVRLAGGDRIAFRPAQRGRSRGHLAELAAYRIGAALGMEGVPPVVLRSEPLARIDRLLDPRFEAKHATLREKLLPRGDSVVGAAIHWVPDLTPSRLDKPEVRERWLEALRVGGEPGAFAAPLLRDLSRLVVFDYLVGNWDRMSGGNLQTDPGGEHVYVRDHNLAFDTPLLPRHEAPLLERLNRVERHSRGFVARLRALDEDALAHVLAPDPVAPSTPILRRDALDGVLARRRVILGRVDALISRYGQRAVLSLD